MCIDKSMYSLFENKLTSESAQSRQFKKLNVYNQHCLKQCMSSTPALLHVDLSDQSINVCNNEILSSFLSLIKHKLLSIVIFH